VACELITCVLGPDHGGEHIVVEPDGSWYRYGWSGLLGGVDAPGRLLATALDDGERAAGAWTSARAARGRAEASRRRARLLRAEARRLRRAREVRLAGARVAPAR
jgi:hypothetical protein